MNNQALGCMLWTDASEKARAARRGVHSAAHGQGGPGDDVKTRSGRGLSFGRLPMLDRKRRAGGRSDSDRQRLIEPADVAGALRAHTGMASDTP